MPPHPMTKNRAPIGSAGFSTAFRLRHRPVATDRLSYLLARICAVFFQLHARRGYPEWRRRCPMREEMPTLPYDLSEFARVHTGPFSWTDEAPIEDGPF